MEQVSEAGTLNEESGRLCRVTLYESVSGTLFHSNKETNPFHNLEQTPSYTIGLLRTNDQRITIVFASHSRDTSGLSSPDGTAIVTTLPNMRHLIIFITDCALPLSLGDS
ncbi:hypothetical protein ACJMK2_031598 [Sinanodonta woodiana]|uniref:Uncharacterized protein n=1 Tax=Sinanodonta woodiana TaxID=1069815 RepID=A0ABD3WZU3_SINWO